MEVDEMKIGLGSDHGGFELKEYIKEYLEKEGIEYVDYGTNSLDSVDYPDYGKKLAEAVVSGEVDRGIAICGTGIGISIACNKVKGIRCALCSDTYSARMSVEHNNANILALGGRVLGKDLALEIVSTWLKAKFQGGRHERRINKISSIESDL
jgi:ribose 5-phosphate isomerase B